jgi:hypothetical protein
MWNGLPSRVLTKPTREVVASLVMSSFRGHVNDQLSRQRPRVSYCFHLLLSLHFFNETFRARSTLRIVSQTNAAG